MKLNVEALAIVAPSDPGDAQASAGQVVLVVSVTDDAGKPVTGLGAASVTIQEIVGPADREVAVAAFRARADGVYAMDVAAAGGWPPGRYVLAVAVARGFDRGQALAKLTIRSAAAPV